MSASAEKQIYDALVSAFAGSPTLATGVYPDVLPEDAVLPAVVYRRAATNPVLVLNGSVTGAAQVTIDVECWAVTRASAELASTAALVGLIAAGLIPGEREGLYDEESKVFAARQAFDVWET